MAHTRNSQRSGRLAALLLCLAASFLFMNDAAQAQTNWSTDTKVTPDANAPGAAQPGVAPGNGFGVLALEAYLTADDQVANRGRIGSGLVWRVFTLADQGQPAKLIETRREAVPTIKLPAGRYAVNAAFGRAYLTEIVDVAAASMLKRSFVLNAGGLRVIVKLADGGKVEKGKAHYDVYSDERDQAGARKRVMTNVQPGLTTRLNSGIYHIVSRLGDANALVSAEVAVEAGKITEAVVSHEAAKVTFKLVKTEAGEAHADTQWIIMTKSGDIIKETAGALPTHVLAPGAYSVSARWSGQLFSRTFEIKSGDNVEIEVMMQ